MLVGILALQGDFTEHAHALGDLGVDTRPLRRPEDLAGIDGLILPGGESTTMSMLLDSSGLAEPVGKELAGGLPAFGTCAGMILLAAQVTDGRADQRCYGAIDVAVRRNGYGRQLQSFECDLAVPVLGEAPVHAVFIRAPVVEALGSEVEVLAVADAAGDTAGSPSRPDRVPTAVLCREGSVLAAAFHPELTSDRRLHEFFVSMIENTERDR